MSDLRGLGGVVALVALVGFLVVGEIYVHGSAMTRAAMVGVPALAVLAPLVFMGVRQTWQRDHLSAASYWCWAAFVAPWSISMTVAAGSSWDGSLDGRHAPLIIVMIASWGLPLMGWYCASKDYCECGDRCEPGYDPWLALVPTLGSVCERCSGVIRSDDAAKARDTG